MDALACTHRRHLGTARMLCKQHSAATWEPLGCYGGDAMVEGGYDLNALPRTEFSDGGTIPMLCCAYDTATGADQRNRGGSALLCRPPPKANMKRPTIQEAGPRKKIEQYWNDGCSDLHTQETPGNGQDALQATQCSNMGTIRMLWR
ncbi:hypothetical protein DAPPUDRAFT_125031 [Daphnia pulex]|uniref:Uncharacterized protein n=1 Tax=Daphnia pulex TaxID=6669 RepID=E9I717_DAPPU|nr:hypothetical protein DAPPUDRAFT_125031 [Daphnia pulex]|eukprot:EFX60213.1 hypothetical protein DAPPUDRAFT_125031 [Daphnia pulex]